MGLFVCIRGKVQTKWNRDGDYEFKPLSIDLLNDLKEKRFKEVNVKMDLADVNETNIARLKAILTENPGLYSIYRLLRKKP